LPIHHFAQFSCRINNYSIIHAAKTHGTGIFSGQTFWPIALLSENGEVHALLDPESPDGFALGTFLLA
jgi:hypothetical protein